MKCELVLLVRRFVERGRFFIGKVVKYYTIFDALNLALLMAMPFLVHEHRLPMETLTPIDYYKHKYAFVILYVQQVGDAFFAGGTNLAVNMFMYATFVETEFLISLMGKRVQEIGHDIDCMRCPKRVSYYREMLESVKYHTEILE